MREKGFLNQLWTKNCSKEVMWKKKTNSRLNFFSKFFVRKAASEKYFQNNQFDKSEIQKYWWLKKSKKRIFSCKNNWMRIIRFLHFNFLYVRNFRDFHIVLYITSKFKIFSSFAGLFFDIIKIHFLALKSWNFLNFDILIFSYEKI